MKIGLLGGTFDPFHQGHIALIEFAISYFNFDELLIIPVGVPPHKNQAMASYTMRCQMINLALPEIKNSSTKIRLSKIDEPCAGKQKNYSVDLLNSLREQYKTEKLIWLLGEDSFCSLPKWKQWHSVIQLCDFAVFSRKKAEGDNTNSSTANQVYAKISEYLSDNCPPPLKYSFGEIEFVDFPLVNVSGKDIRRVNNLANSKNNAKNILAESVSKSIGDYIIQNHLYIN